MTLAKRGSVVVEYALLISLAVALVAAVWGVWRVFIFKETETAEDRLDRGVSAVYDPACLRPGEQSEWVKAASIGGPIVTQTSAARAAGLPAPPADWDDRRSGTLYQLPKQLDETAFNSDFNGDGDADDVIDTAAQPDGRAESARLGGLHPSGGLRVVHADVFDIYAAQHTRSSGPVLVHSVTSPSGVVVGHETAQLGDAGLEGGVIFVSPAYGCWGVVPAP